MKILALATIMLSLTSGNSNFEVSQKCNKALYQKHNSDSIELFGICRFDGPVTILQDCNCQDLTDIKEICKQLDFCKSSFYYSCAQSAYSDKKCDQIGK